MKLHRNARLAPHGPTVLVERVVGRQMSLQAAALSAGVSTRTASRWIARYRAEGELGMYDRSSAPHRVPGRTAERRVVTIAALRQLRMTAAEIAEVLEMPLSTVSAVVLRIGLGKRSRLELPEPPNRYERARPGALIHIDIKTLGRIQGGVGKRMRSNGRRHYTPTRKTPTGTTARPSSGSTSRSASTTPPALPTSKSSTTRKATPLQASCAAPLRTTPATAFPANA
jgi:transposase